MLPDSFSKLDLIHACRVQRNDIFVTEQLSSLVTVRKARCYMCLPASLKLKIELLDFIKLTQFFQCDLLN